ncbi:CORVET complex membrane-binding subunit VPS8 [Aspergillus ruber CBS 135680]|uniref:Putative Golgi complex component n=1 Tax=Aspergillus ruber (strain CBS 135680) TaxID=1388766 RepID=A0A017S3I4_ASPRC|nr:putative Golgi complex component [Aspergillus ruber CBS 135680]EYE91507.1 putative Golgi complex component [Aspergillus ruber CBS 135680]
MSSMVEDSHDWAREDELDLGQDEQDQEQYDATPGQNRNGNDSSPVNGDNDSIVHAEEGLSPGPEVNGHGQSAGVEDDALPVDLSSSPRPELLRGSMDETASTPDDTPSLQGSFRSSPSSNLLALRPSPSPSHRPFDLRFQSRLSSPSSPFGSRTSSPYLGYIHSRHSSLVSQLSPGTVDSGDENPQGPWDVVRWTRLRKISGQAFSEVGKRNFGHPTCMTVTTSIVIGTSKGVVLVFDYQQSLKAIIGPSTRALECGAITALALSADHSTVAAGHASGDIFTWEISRSARPFLQIPPIPSEQIDSRTSDGHISGSSVVHIGFLGTRRTALVSADKRGMAFSHLATRGMGAVGRTVKITRILGRYPLTIGEAGRPRKPSAILAFSPLPLGNVEQPTDTLGLVAMLTPYLLVIVSTTPVAQTQYKSPRPKEVTAHGAMTGALAWFPAIRLKGKDAQISNTKLVYCWSNVLTILEVSEMETDEPPSRDRPPQLEFKARSRWVADEAIVAVQWLSRSVLAVLTITQQLLILEDGSMRVTDSIDLLNRHIYHMDLFSGQLHSLVEQFHEEDASMHGVVADAFYMSFRSYKGRLFLLGYNETFMGALSNWADRLLALMEAGDFIGAIKMATSYFKGSAEKLTVGLPEEDALRQPIVRERLLEMISASLKYAFGRNAEANNERLEGKQLAELVKASITACVCMEELEFLWDEVFTWYEEHESQGIFLDALESYIVEGTVRSLPPTAVKALINHYFTNHSASGLEEIICLLDTTTMDIDQVTSLCKQYNLYDAYIYVWNCCLGDYIGPLQDLLEMIPPPVESFANGESADVLKQYANAVKMFPYLSFVLTGRIYPTGEPMDGAESARAKGSLYDYLFSGSPSYSDLHTMLQFDTPSFMSMLNEAFEDSFLNEQDPDEVAPSQGIGASINRQYLITILLQVMSSASSSFTPSDTIYLDMFVARNLPKYPQYILLSGTTLHNVLERLCHYPNPEMSQDCELSVEYLLSFYHPPDIQRLIPLFREARFFRVLKATYRAEKQFPQLILTHLEDPIEQEAVFTCLQDCLRPGSGLGKKQRRDVVDVVQDNARSLTAINVTRAAQSMQELAPETHNKFLQVLEEDSYRQYQYLVVIIEPQTVRGGESRCSDVVEPWMVERYVQLLCKYNPTHVADFVDDLQTSDVRLEELLPYIEDSGIVDAAVILLARQGEVRGAMDRLLAHLETLQSGLVGILRSIRESPDSASTAEAIGDLVESLNKYARVGTWLCQGQSKMARQLGGGPINGTRSITELDQPLSFDEGLWLDLIEAIVRIASNVFTLLSKEDLANTKAQQAPTSSQYGSNAAQLISSFRTLVQQIFTTLLSNTVKGGSSSPSPASISPSMPTTPTTPKNPSSVTPLGSQRNDISFLRILRSFLTRAATWSPSLLELRTVLSSIFSAYTYERSLLSLANGMLDRDLFVHVDEVTRLRQRGWRPRGQTCEICREKIWGPGVGMKYWRSWEERQGEQSQHRMNKMISVQKDPVIERGKGKAAAHHRAISQSAAAIAAAANQSSNDQKTVVNDDEETPTPPNPDSEPASPAVIFSCRHLYHRECLVAIGGPSRSVASRADQPVHFYNPDGSGWVPVCPVCT